MKYIMLFCMLLVLPAGSVCAETVSRVAAIVNGEIITTFQLEQVVDQERQSNNSNEFSDEQLKRVRSRILERMIDEKLLIQRSRELGLSVSENELELAIEDVQRQNNLTRDQLLSALKDQGMVFPLYREKLEAELLRYKLIEREVNNQVEVTSKEVREYFREHIDEYRVSPTVHLKRISFEISDDASPELQTTIREQAETVRHQLMIDKVPFDAVLASLGETSEDDMGSITVDSLMPIFQEPIRNLKIGEVSVPIATPGGLHLFLVADRNPGDRNLFDRVEDEIRERLRADKTDKRFAEWLQELRDDALIEIRL